MKPKDSLVEVFAKYIIETNSLNSPILGVCDGFTEAFIENIIDGLPKNIKLTEAEMDSLADAIQGFVDCISDDAMDLAKEWANEADEAYREIQEALNA